MEIAFRRSVIGAAVAAALLGSVTAPAANLFAMRNMPVSRMTEEDRDMLRAAAVEALEKDKPTAWENPKTGAHGTLAPIAGFDRDGRPCHDLEVEHSVRGRSNRLVLTACRQDDGDWKVEP